MTHGSYRDSALALNIRNGNGESRNFTVMDTPTSYLLFLEKSPERLCLSCRHNSPINCRFACAWSISCKLSSTKIQIISIYVDQLCHVIEIKINFPCKHSYYYLSDLFSCLIASFPPGHSYISRDRIIVHSDCFTYSTAPLKTGEVGY